MKQNKNSHAQITRIQKGRGWGWVGGMYLTEDTCLTLTLTEVTNPETIHTRIERNTSVRCEETIFTTSSRLNNSKMRYLIQQISIFPSEIPESELPDRFCSFFHKKDCICSQWTWFTTCWLHSHISLFCWQWTFWLWASVTCKPICDSALKSCVLDHIPTTWLRTYLDDLVPLICRIVNESLLTCPVHLWFKEAVMTPLLKNKQKETTKTPTTNENPPPTHTQPNSKI